MPIRIIIADDHSIVRQGLKRIASADDQMVVVGEAENGADLLNKLKAEKADVLILDLSMPGRNGIEILKDIKRIDPSLPVLVLSMHPEDQYAVRALRAGAAGYMTKELAADDLVAAIRTVYKGSRYITPRVAELMADHLDLSTPEERFRVLSDREYEVFLKLARAETVGQISTELNLSAKTVSTYRTRILEKMGMSSNAELTRYALDHDLL